MSDAFIPYGTQSVDDEDVAAISAAVLDEFLTTGPAVDNFERRLSDVVGGASVAAVSSGTAALHCAYRALQLGPGDEVITTPFTFAATATAALVCGARVTFADVDEDTLNVNPEAVEDGISTKTRVITAVDYSGHPADIASLSKIAERSDTTLVEDAAHSLGATVDGHQVGSLAAVTTFSFHPVKIITTAEGGAVAAMETSIVDAVKTLRNHGLVHDPSKYSIADQGAWHQEIQTLGFNYRLPDLLAALGSAQLTRLPAFLARRREIAGRYLRELDPVEGLRLPTVRAGVEPAWHLFVVRILEGRRREVFDRLRAERIGVQVHYLPVHMQPLFKEIGYEKGSCPVAERAYEEVLSLPIYPRMSASDQERVIDALRTALAG
ncbi:MAG: hypothetical protein QOG04_987 [Actinomycetota bacterium]|jgi:perosamine synthetase|nr:hypothetical protein [Actinomycetota bacterium]